jgi:protein-tyrosine phosphatase
MIDTHLHILPGVDDGPGTIEEALALAKALVQQGIHTAIATPHYNDEFVHLTMVEIRRRVDDLQQELVRHSIPLRLFPGHEALISPELVADVRSGKVATLNGSRYLLLELWNSAWIPETERVIFELRALGIIPIIAHPERYRSIQQNPDRLHGLLEQGALTQLTAASLSGIQGRAARACAEMLLKKGYVHFIASDAHSDGTRLAAVKQALGIVEYMLGQEEAQQMSEARPCVVVQNEELRLHR